MGCNRTLSARAAIVAGALIMLAPIRASSEDGAEDQQLRKELEAVKEQLRRVEQRMQQQDELIRKLTGEKQAPPAAFATEEEQRKAEALKQQIEEDIREKLQPALAAANKTFPSQFNPAIGFIIDTVASYSRRDQANFDFRSGELGLSASVDPFARAYAFINGTDDGVEVEEAAIVTTSLPYNLTMKGGRFFADFGRLSKFHDHDLPFVNRPTPLDSYVGGEAQSDGIEASWLAPLTSQYLNLEAGWYNKMGADNDRVSNAEPRELSQFTYMGRANTYLDLGNAHGVDLGVSDAYTPKVDVDEGKSRNLLDVDLTYRYTPLGEAAYRGLVWGNEFLLNSENRQQNVEQTQANPGLPPQFSRVNAFGMYSYLEARLTRRLHPGFLFEYTQDLNGVASAAEGYSPYLTIWASEFQRFRLQYTHLSQPGGDDDQFFLQWTVAMGSHAHGFRDR
ncbi:MAG: hypothetical protein ABW298_14340 [Candidatus Binatia bacterium]